MFNILELTRSKIYCYYDLLLNDFRMQTEQQHICRCGKSYKTLSTLNVHIRRYTDKHTCTICRDYTTSAYSILKKHYNISHPNTLYQDINLMQKELSLEHFIYKTTSTSFKRRRPYEFKSTQYEPSTSFSNNTTDAPNIKTPINANTTTPANIADAPNIKTPINTNTTTTTNITDAPTSQDTATSSTLKRPYPPNTVSNNNNILTINDYNTLNPNGKLNDNIIDAYYTLITRNSSFAYAFNCFFLESLEKKRLSYLRKNNKIDLVKYNMLIYPIHIKNPAHWTVIIINFNLKYIHHLDPYPNQIITNHTYIDKIHTFLDTYTTLHNLKKYNWVEWEFTIPRNIPLQSSVSNDCGVFICIYVKYLCNHQPLNTITIPHNLDTIRDTIRHELQTNTLTE